VKAELIIPVRQRPVRKNQRCVVNRGLVRFDINPRIHSHGTRGLLHNARNIGLYDIVLMGAFSSRQKIAGLDPLSIVLSAFKRNTVLA